MTDGYAILMACFGAALLLCAACLAGTKNPRSLPRMRAVREKDARRQAKRVARTLALVALAVLLSALVSRLTGSAPLALIVLAAGGAGMIWLGTRGR